jgi:hypothetical protein
MIHITCLADLVRFGIHPLTSESDKLGFRVLCDLTDNGCDVVRECFGLKDGVELFEDNWNYYDGAIASFMLPKACIEPLAIVGFVLGGMIAVQTDQGVVGLQEYEDVVHGMYVNYKHKQTPLPWPVGSIQQVFRPAKVLRNPHASGRLV